MPTKWFLVSEEQLTVLSRVRDRLYTEQRMNGDAMRNAAQVIDSVIRVCQQNPDK